MSRRFCLGESVGRFGRAMGADEGEPFRRSKSLSFRTHVRSSWSMMILLCDKKGPPRMRGNTRFRVTTARRGVDVQEKSIVEGFILTHSCISRLPLSTAIRTVIGSRRQ